jgi:predicted HTH domain antitoxin
MTTLPLDIPDVMLLQANGSLLELKKETQLECALLFFQKGRLSSGQAAEMADMNRVDFLLLASQRGIPVVDLDEEEWGLEKKHLGIHV